MLTFVFCLIQSCLAYVENLTKVPKAALEAANTRIVVVGCGEAKFIKTYKGICFIKYEPTYHLT